MLSTAIGTHVGKLALAAIQAVAVHFIVSEASPLLLIVSPLWYCSIAAATAFRFSFALNRGIHHFHHQGDLLCLPLDILSSGCLLSKMSVVFNNL